MQVRIEIQSSVPKSPTVDPRSVFFQFAQRHLMLSRGPGEESWRGALPFPERTNSRITNRHLPVLPMQRAEPTSPSCRYVNRPRVGK